MGASYGPVGTEIPTRSMDSRGRPRPPNSAASTACLQTEDLSAYTSSGGRVAVSIHKDVDKIVVFIEDNGVGLSDEGLPHVFERFHRCDPSRSQPGGGLGLSLVEATVKAHGGNVAVASSPGKGATFEITLPRASAMKD